MEAKLHGKLWFDVLKILVGSSLVAISFRYLTFPNSIVSGGVTGIAQIVNLLTGLPVGIVTVARGDEFRASEHAARHDGQQRHAAQRFKEISAGTHFFRLFWIYKVVSRRLRQRTLMPPPSWICRAIRPYAAPIFASVMSAIASPLSHVCTRSPCTRRRSVFHSPSLSADSFSSGICTSHPRP